VADNTELATIADLEEGLRFGHMLMSMNRHISQEGACYAQAILELLLEKEVITPEEFEGKVEAHRKEMANYPDVKLSKGPDKYECEEVVIDCLSRLHLCRAVCCMFRFFVTPQDLDEGMVKWDYGNPYWIRQQENGYCIHCDPDTLTCQIHENRPYTCRLYDCREDERVWVDFEKAIHNPELDKLGARPSV
jgi:Fe-S-cluster containining protein